jgi:hypothetical protein
MKADILDRLAAANPVPTPSSVRVGAAPSFPATAGSRRRRLAVVALAFAAAVFVGGSALALHFGTIEFSSAEHAPPRVVADFESLSTAAPPGMDPGVIAGETRQLRIGDRVLWIAPTRAGGLCYGWNHSSGGCDKLGTTPLSTSWLGRPFRAPAGAALDPSHDYYAVEGFAHAQWVDSVELRLDDGTTVRPELTWISKPIDAGFFFYVAPRKHDVVSAVGYRNGEAVTGEDPLQNPGPHPYARLDERTKLGELATAAGPVRLWAAPTKTDGRCVWLQFGGEEKSVAPCLPKGYERQVAFSTRVDDLGGTTVLSGECGYAAVELVQRDGTARRIDCVGGIVFSKLSSEDEDGTLRALDAGGTPLPGSEVPIRARHS